MKDEDIYKKLKKLSANKNDSREFKPIYVSDLQVLLNDHRFTAQIELLKELLKGKLRDLKKKYGSYEDYSFFSRAVFVDDKLK